jgi:hypothetical protein
MRSFRSRLYPIAALSLLAGFAGTAAAQEAPATAPPRGKELKSYPTPPGAAHLAKEFGISLAEASRRIALQDRIGALAEQLQAGTDPEFAGIWIQHAPSFKVVIAFTKPSDAKLSALTIDPEIRSLIELRALPRGRGELLAEQDRIITLLPRTIQWVSYIEEETGRLAVRVETEVVAQQVRSLLAASGLSQVAVVLGPVPDHVAAPRGVQPGDYIDGGHHYYGTNQVPAGLAATQEEQYRGCTFAFPARLGTTQGILTAGHCDPGSPAATTGTGYWHAINGHWVELPVPTIARWGYGTKYDYQFHETTGYDDPVAFVYYVNKTGEPNFYSSGHLSVKGTLGYYGQTAGMMACKSGWRTGVTCARIRNGAYTYNGARGWIELYRASGAHLAKPGDSGGAVFSPADTGANITAYGIATAADSYSDGSSVFVYNPIDYIDDESPIRVVLNTEY